EEFKPSVPRAVMQTFLHWARDKDVSLVASQPPDRDRKRVRHVRESCSIEERSKGPKRPAIHPDVDRQIELLFTACGDPVPPKPFRGRHRQKGIGESETITVAKGRSDRTCKFTCRHADQQIDTLTDA